MAKSNPLNITGKSILAGAVAASQKMRFHSAPTVCLDCGNTVALDVRPIDSDRLAFREVGSWGDDRDFQCGLSEDYQHHAKCAWYARCDNEADGTVTHPALGDVPTCRRCASKHDMMLDPVNEPGTADTPSSSTSD